MIRFLAADLPLKNDYGYDMKIYQATWPAEESQARALQKAGISNRLLSYYFIVTEENHDPDDWMEEYGQHGIVRKRKATETKREVMPG